MSKRHWRLNRKYLDPNNPAFIHWLVYSELFDGVFCFPCFLFQKSLLSSSVNAPRKLVSEPYTRWSTCTKNWSDHQNTKMHRNCTGTMQVFIRQMEGNEKTIDNIISNQRRELIQKNREKLMSILKTVVFCGHQNIALRGHRDDSKYFQEDHSNTGNFQALLNFRIDSGDKVLEEHFTNAPKNSTYRSKTIQNELIHSCETFIRNMLAEEITQAKFFSIIADEASDASSTEQLAIVLRFVDSKGEIREEFVEFLKCDSVSGESLTGKIKDCLNSLSLELKNVRGQAYDGAGNMAGSSSGVSSRILQENPRALYFHCSSHRLNLAVASCIQIRGVQLTMDAVKRCSDLFHFSPKKQKLLLDSIVDEFPQEKRTKLLDVCRTRWIQRIDGLERIQELVIPILVSLSSIAENHDGSYKREARSDAAGLHSNMTSFNFAVHLIVLRKVLSYTYPLTFELQKKQLDVVHVYKAIDNVVDTLSDCRDNVDAKHSEWYDEAVEFALKSCGTSPSIPRVVGKQKHRENYVTPEPKEYYKLSLTIPLLDQLINELRNRFSSDHRIFLKSNYIIPSVVVKNKDWKQNIADFSKEYASDLPQPLNVASEMDQWEVYWKKEIEAGTRIPDTITDTLVVINSKKHWFPNLHTILCLIAVVPASSNSCERSISKLKLLKTRLRSILSQDRLSSLMFLNVH